MFVKSLISQIELFLEGIYCTENTVYSQRVGFRRGADWVRAHEPILIGDGVERKLQQSLKFIRDEYIKKDNSSLIYTPWWMR